MASQTQNMHACRGIVSYMYTSHLDACVYDGISPNVCVIIEMSLCKAVSMLLLVTCMHVPMPGGQP